MTSIPAPGDTILGKYRVENVLGQGGMGVVVAARHIELGELYAIKMMLPNSPGHQDDSGRFLREARSAAKLKSEHVARVHDVGRTDDGALFMVMEHLEGCDLKAHLAASGRLSADEAITYVLQACEALAEAHEMGIVHRDIKPANLFLTRKRKTGTAHVKVLDFGISKELDPAPGQDLTKTGAMLGSPLYMSPEQMAHARTVDTRTDIWSLGVVLYQFVTGIVPFPGETFTQVVHSVLSVEPAHVRSFVADLPVGLDVVIKRCLQKDAAKRYATVEALSEALEKVLKGEPIDDTNVVDGHADTIKVPPTPQNVGIGLEATDVGTHDPFADKLSPNAEIDKPSPTESANSDKRTHAQQTSTTLQSQVPPAPNTKSAPRKRTNYVAVVAIGACVVGAAVWIDFRSPSRPETSNSDGLVPNELPIPTPSSETTLPVPTTPTAASVGASASSDVIVAPAVSSTNGAAAPTKTPVSTSPASSAKNLQNAGDQVVPSTTASSKTPMDEDHWRRGPL